jgi:hypothetical protein
MKTKNILWVFLLAATSVLTLNSCTSDSDFESGKRNLETQGYTNIQPTGYEMFCCSEDESFSTGFSATDKNGNTVTGCFCSAFLKGVTVRFN